MCFNTLTLIIQLQCCGNRGYADWFNLYPPKNVPFSCCKVPKDKCDPDEVEQIYTEVRFIVEDKCNGMLNYIKRYFFLNDISD